MSSSSSSIIISKVGFLGFTGKVGSSVLPNLIELNKQNKIKLILLHRQGSDLSKIAETENIEKRIIKLDENGLEINKKAIENLDIVVSTVGTTGFRAQIHLIDSLENSKSLKTFIHSDFGTNWTEDELQAPGLKMIKIKEDIVDYAKSKKVPLTSIRVGVLDEFFYKYPASGTYLPGNTVQVFRNSLKNKIRVTSIPFLGYAIAQLTINPISIANQITQLYDFNVSGEEIIQAWTNIQNGIKPEITYYTEDQYQKDLQVIGGFAIIAAVRAKWGDDNWGPSDQPKIDGWKLKTFEQHCRNFIQ
ncbi:uncharacterized protein L201_005021 [Kwoniella dendrophila CBS 6074]|uniref:NmrA-like domain-containing protein n=1 Tax=Kwoniella dendrophila CBS 6074 TaxID=1295534 RepID=A0AAX4JZZ1_9TREE